MTAKFNEELFAGGKVREHTIFNVSKACGRNSAASAGCHSGVEEP